MNRRFSQLNYYDQDRDVLIFIQLADGCYDLHFSHSLHSHIHQRLEGDEKLIVDASINMEDYYDSEDEYDLGTMEVQDLTNLSLSELNKLLHNDEPELELRYISDEAPDRDHWTLPILVGYDVKGRAREWQIWFIEPELHIQHGLQDGQKQLERVEVIPKVKRNIYEQAWLEASSRYNNMIKKGYRMEGEADSNLFKVMRAQIFRDNSVLEFPCFYDYKMDGYRHYICSNNGKIQGYSREGSLRTHLTHLDEGLLQLFKYLPPGTILDTELYRHGMVFEDISSAIRTQLKEHEKLKDLQVHIFDACWDRVTPFEQRRNRLEIAMMKYYDEAGIEYRKRGKPEQLLSRDLSGKKMHVVIGNNLLVEPSINIRLSIGWVANSRRELNEAMSKSVRPLIEGEDPYSSENLKRGYEGIMIKRCSNGVGVESQYYKMTSYFYGKCAHIYKYKMIQDMEGLCIGIEDSSGREKGCAMLKILILSGVTFMLKMDGSQERRREWFNNPDLILGKLINFTYQRLSDAGVPMFAVGRRIRDDLSIKPYYDMVEESYTTLTPREIEIVIEAYEEELE